MDESAALKGLGIFLHFIVPGKAPWYEVGILFFQGCFRSGDTTNPAYGLGSRHLPVSVTFGAGRALPGPRVRVTAAKPKVLPADLRVLLGHPNPYERGVTSDKQVRTRRGNSGEVCGLICTQPFLIRVRGRGSAQKNPEGGYIGLLCVKLKAYLK